MGKMSSYIKKEQILIYKMLTLLCVQTSVSFFYIVELFLVRHYPSEVEIFGDSNDLTGPPFDKLSIT